MPKTRLHELSDKGQSAWLDYIDRSLIESGGLEDYVQKGVRGVTSNPAIFEKAIAEGDIYDDAIQELALQGKSAQEIYKTLAIEDAQNAADVLRPVFDEAGGSDGYFSLEVNPHLAHDAKGTIKEAKELFKAVDRSNLMIKVPATSEGFLAIRELITEGLNINVTLMFSLAQYDLVAEAYLKGLEKRAANVYDLTHIYSVASFFVSRIDVKVDQMLEKIGTPEARELKGKIGIANAKMAYQRFRETFQGQRWNSLSTQGARIQRVLYGSTSTKNPDYSDVLYVNNLIGKNTINTLPPKTIDAFLDHGEVGLTLARGMDDTRKQLNQLAKVGINLDNVTQELLDEGIEKFAKPYDKLIETIAEKQADLITAGAS